MSEKLPLTGLKALLIDDSNTVRRSGEIFLSQAGCQVVLAEDGFDGLSRAAESNPDIIFVDVMMPRLDGFQTCALFKSHPDFKHIPVIMLTSKDTLFDRARGKLTGSDQYLIKPFNKRNLVETVINHTQQGDHEHGY